MGFFDQLFGGGSNPTPQSPPAGAPAAPPQLPQSYGDFFTNLANAVNSRSYFDNLTGRISQGQGLLPALIGSIGQDGRTVAQLQATAPEAYLKYRGDLAGVANSNLDTAQTMALMHRGGFDPSSYLPQIGGIASGDAGSPSPAPANSASPTGPQGFAQASSPAAMSQALQVLLARNNQGATPPITSTPLGMPGAPDPSQTPAAAPGGINVPGVGIVPPNGTPMIPGNDGDTTGGLPPGITPTSAPLLSGGMTSPAPNGAPPPAVAPQPGNLANAQRALFSNLATSMVGLPKFAPMALDYRKLAQTGLPEGVIAGPNGQPLDPITGQPITQDVGTLAAQRAGQVSSAQGAATLPYTEAADTNRALLDRGTNAAKIGDENAYKPPTLMRAPDGSVVAVTPTQMAMATQSGALNGYRPLTDEDTKALGALGEQYAKDQASLPDVRKFQGTIATMLDQAKGFVPGTFGETRQAAGRLLAGLGADRAWIAKNLGSPANADALVKDTFQLATQHLRDTLGAGREAGFLVLNAIKANPNITTQDEAYRFMLNGMNQEAQRQADYLTAEQNYRQQHGTIDGFAEAFDRANPVQNYVSAAYANTYGAPAGSQFLGRHQGRPVFSFNGKKFAVAQ